MKLTNRDVNASGSESSSAGCALERHFKNNIDAQYFNRNTRDRMMPEEDILQVVSKVVYVDKHSLAGAKNDLLQLASLFVSKLSVSNTGSAQCAKKCTSSSPVCIFVRSLNSAEHQTASLKDY